MSRSRRSRRRVAQKTRRKQMGGKRCMFVQPVDDEGLGNELYRYGMALGGQQPDMTLCKLPQRKLAHNPSKNYRDLFNGENFGEKNDRVDKAKNVVNPTNTPRTGNAKIPYSSWQGYHYVKDAIDMVKDNLMRNEFEKHADQYTFHHDPSKTAFIHVRLGDYEATGWAIPFTYYDRALKLLFKKASHVTHVMVLSDDIKKCEAHWSNTPELEFVKGKNELQSLYIMMKCEAGAILSASTYSSWGAYLGADRKARNRPKPVIIYPTPWLHGKAFPMKFPDWWTPLSTGLPIKHEGGDGAPLKWAVLQYDNRPLSAKDEALTARHKYYCEKHGYEYVFITKSDRDVPPYWQKVYIVKEHLPKYKGILWMDTDATIFNLEIPLDNYITKDHSFYKSIDSGGNQIFNAGVWIVMNNEMGMKILDDWIAKYDEKMWRKDGAGWHTDTPWAGDAYEQGSFAHKVVPEHENHIKTLDENVLQSNDMDDKNTFILHFWRGKSSQIEEFLKRFPEPSSGPQKGGMRHPFAQKGGKRPCIVVEMYDQREGLGNKLGVYAAALRIQNKEMDIPICIMGTGSKHSSTDYARLFDAEAIDRPSNLNSIKNIMVPQPRDDLTEISNSANTSNINAGKNVKISSVLYQNFGLFIPVMPKMREMLERNEFSKDEYKPFKTEIESATSAFMHVRRGDYVGEGWIIPDDYYKNGLKAFDEVDAIKTIYVFSNEPGWCAKQLEGWKEVSSKKIICKDDSNELHVLYMMSICKAGAIISASTFSAWGAMLGPNENPNAKIIYPTDMPQFKRPGASKPKDPKNPMSFPANWIGM